MSLETSCLTWRAERNSDFTLHSDASKGVWRAILVQHGKKKNVRDYWKDASLHINVLEASDLSQALAS